MGIEIFAVKRRLAEIIGPSGRVHYRRPIDHKMVAEAKTTPGYSVRIVDAPDDLIIELTCDSPKSLECDVSQTFVSGYIEAHTNAMRSGWLERDAPKGRLWICPSCSGKKCG